MTSQSDNNQKFPRAKALIEKYIQAATAIGQPLDGLEMAELWIALSTPETEQVLEILETIRTYEDAQPQIAYSGHTHVVNPAWVNGSPNLPANSSGTPAPSPHKHQTTGGQFFGINEWRSSKD